MDRQARFAKALLAPLLAGLLLAAPGCRTAQVAPYGGEDVRSAALRAQIDRDPAALDSWLASGDAATRRLAVRALGRMGGDAAAARAAELLADDDASVREAAAFAVGATGSDRAPALLEAKWPKQAKRDTTALAGAAAMGLGFCRAPEAESLLIELACRADRPVEAPAALFSYYRWSGRPAPARLPRGRLYAYLDHPDPRGRAGLGWIGRVIKDPAMILPLTRLSKDRDPEVRRAGALALAEGRPNADDPSKSTVRAAPAAARAQLALRDLLSDPDPRVTVAAVRALGSYGTSTARLDVLRAVAHPDFNVRAAVAQSLGRPVDPQKHPALARRITEEAVPALLHRLRTDRSVSVRYEAASALANVAPEAARGDVERLLESALEYDRVAAVGILAKDASESGTRRLVLLADGDPHVRVRHTALGALEGRKGEMVVTAVRTGLDDADPVVVAVACGVAAANELTQLDDLIREVPARHPGMAGADAREGAVGAIAKRERAADRSWFATFRDDPSPAVRWAATQALASLDAPGEPPAEPPFPPVPDSRDPANRHGFAQPAASVLARLRSLSRNPRLEVRTDSGRFVIELAVDEAPLHCAHVVDLAERGFYDGLTWHRVVPDFVIQGGCPRGDGAGSADLALPLEPTRLPYGRGTLGMPRSAHPDTGGCQLFICHSRAPHLDLHYTAFGRVVAGLDVIDRVDVDDVIRRVRLEAAE